MKTIIGHAMATLTLHHDIEIEVGDDLTPEEIATRMQDEANFAFQQDVCVSPNGPALDISVAVDDEEEKTPPAQEGDLYTVKVDYHYWREYHLRAVDDMEAIALVKTGKFPTYNEGGYNDDGDITVDRVE